MGCQLSRSVDHSISADHAQLVNAVQHWTSEMRRMDTEVTQEGGKTPSGVHCAYGIMQHWSGEIPGNAAHCSGCKASLVQVSADVPSKNVQVFLLMAKSRQESIYGDVTDSPAGARSCEAVNDSQQTFTIQMDITLERCWYLT